MNRYLITLALSTIVLSQTPVLAWNTYGHMSVAYVAYQKLTPQVRTCLKFVQGMNITWRHLQAEYVRGAKANSYQ